MASNGETFALSLHAFAKKAPEQARNVVRKVSIDLLTATVLRTPVGNPDVWKRHSAPKGYVGGRLRANWFVSLVAPDESTTSSVDDDGQQTIQSGTTVILGAGDDGDIFITNSLPYALPIEYGHSGAQAPEGMVRVTVAEFQQFVQDAVNSPDEQPGN